MTHVVHVIWFLYPKFQVSLEQILVLLQLQYGIVMTEIGDLRRHPQEIILRKDQFLIRLSQENS